MKVKVTKWGNSMGIRLPAEAIKLAQLQAGSELHVKVNEKQGVVLLEPVKHPRKNWQAAFDKIVGGSQVDLLIDDSLPTDFDRDDWQW